MMELAKVHSDASRLEAFMVGVAVNAAMSDNPAKHLANILNPPKPIRAEEVHPMLRPHHHVKKKAQDGS